MCSGTGGKTLFLTEIRSWRLQAEAGRETAVAEMEKARTETEWLDIENRAQERTRAKLDEEIAGKGSWADRESGNTILSGLANIAGRGRYAEIKNRNRKLEASLPTEKERLQNPFTKQAEAEIRKLACELCP